VSSASYRSQRQLLLSWPFFTGLLFIPTESPAHPTLGIFLHMLVVFVLLLKQRIIRGVPRPAPGLPGVGLCPALSAVRADTLNAAASSGEPRHMTGETSDTERGLPPRRQVAAAPLEPHSPPCPPARERHHGNSLC